MTAFRARMQAAEILGPDNRWYCAQFYGRRIDEPNVLARYFCTQGGAVDFERRFKEAMSSDNRWYCSEFHRQEITEPAILWRYYMTHRNAGRRTGPPDRNKAC